MGSISQFEEYAGALLRGHLSAGKGIRRIGLVEVGENTDYFLHNLILRWFFNFGGPRDQRVRIHAEFRERLRGPQPSKS